MSVAPGSKLGPYEVLSPLGAGGMGEVYKAKDTRLDRSVALKVLPLELARDPLRRERLNREARAISALDHPHICALYDVGAHDGMDFLVMQYLEGETLADRLKRGALPLEQALDLARQMASALAAAHEVGIVHRDLKPGNVMLTKSGVKLLDFGLARLRPASFGEASADESALTEARPLTQEGAIVGTLQYMAPEQLEGKEADARSDIYAFGAVLYEMVTGRRVYDEEHRRELTPPLLESVVSRALAKSPGERWQSARDIEILLGLPQAPVPAVLPRRRFAHAVWASVVVLAAWAAWWARKPAPHEATRVVIRLPEGEDFRGGAAPDFAISPDGRRIVFASRPATRSPTTLYLRELARFEPKAFPDAGNAVQPAFSPDGALVAFATMPEGSIAKMGLRDGIVTKITSAPRAVTGLAWTEDGSILLGTNRGILRIDANGGDPEPVTHREPGELSHILPNPLPGGRAFLFTVGHAASFSVALARSHGSAHTVLLEGYGATYVRPGYIVYGRRGSPELFVVPFDLEMLEVQGPPVAIEAGVYVQNNIQPHFVASLNGTVVFASGKASRTSVVWVSRDGAEEKVHAFEGRYHSLDLSPDGSRFVADDAVGQNPSIWGHDLTRGTRFLLASGAGLHVPRYTPDGTSVVYSVLDGDLFLRSADGTGEPRPLLAKDIVMWPLSWSRDGKFLAFMGSSKSSTDSGNDVWILPRGAEPYPFVATPANEPAAAFSPDGTLIAYQSDESGRPEIYIQPFPGPGARVLISTEGGKEPVFSSDGRELFYREGTAVVAVPITAGPPLQAGKPEVLFDGPYQADGTGHPAYDVSPDNKRFLMIRNEGAGEIDLRVVLNFGEELKAKVPRK